MNYSLGQFQINSKELINFENKRFPLIPYETELHSELAYRLQDPDLAKMIYDAYTKELRPILEDQQQALFEKALLKVCLLFGSSKFPPHLALRLALLEENFPVDEWMQAHEHSFQRFMKDANRNLYPTRMPKHSGTLAHIVMTTTSAAGGNLAVAEGLKTLLEGKYKVTVIDVEELSKEVDHLKIATGTHTFDAIYAEVVQQKNALEEGFNLQMGTGREVARYIEPTLGKVLKQRIAQLNPDFILSTRNGHELDISLSHSLEIPGCTIHCDCEVGYYYNNMVGKTEGQLFKIWLPEDCTRVFKPVFDRIGKSWEDYQNLPWNVFKKSLAGFLHIPTEILENQIEFVGAPTRPEIRRIKDKTQINQLREKWELANEEEAILVTLGLNGVGKMREIFDDLLTASAHEVPIKYYFVCGTNHQLRAEFEEKLRERESLAQSALKRCSIFGRISPTEMNELLNISTLVQGKPGGSQKEEYLKIGIPLMIVFSHEYWESGNQAKLEREGFSLSYHPEESIVTQTERHMRVLKEHKAERPKRRRWKQLIPLAIERALKA